MNLDKTHRVILTKQDKFLLLEALLQRGTERVTYSSLLKSLNVL